MLKFVDTIKELLAIYFALIFLCAAAYAQVEHKDIFDAVWWACVTALTVGYGDMYPVTVTGKLIAMFLMHVTVLLILPLMIGQICSRCIKNQDAFTHAEQEEIKRMLEEIKNKSCSCSCPLSPNH